MGTEELLAIVGIILTIIAFISEKNRSYILLKFSTLSKIILIFCFILIHYLIVFDWIQENWFPYLSSFTIDEGIPSTAWAYIITVITILFMLYIIFYSFFPTENIKKVISYYNKLNLSSEHPYLLELIRTYHLDDVPVYLNSVRDINNNADSFDLQASREIEKKISAAVNTPRLKYANNVLFEIIDNEVFINHTANVDPYFYTKIIQCLNAKNRNHSDMVKRYLEILMRNKNYHFFREINNNLESDKGGKYRLNEKNIIIFSLFSDIKVAEYNSVWKPVADVAIWELKDKNSKEFIFLQSTDVGEQYDLELSNTKISIAITFFDIMIREAIYQKAEHHMWLIYYHRFVEVLIANIQDNYNNQNNDKSTLSHRLILCIINNMMAWLEVGVNLKINNLSIDICRCIGECIYEITSSDILSNELKGQVLELLLHTYFELGYDTEAEFQMLELQKILLTPSHNVKSVKQRGNVKKYKNAMNLAWRNFDKMLYEQEENRAYDEFRTNLLERINRI